MSSSSFASSFVPPASWPWVSFLCGDCPSVLGCDCRSWATKVVGRVWLR